MTALRSASAVEPVPLGGDFLFVPGKFCADGIDATPDGKKLVIVHMGLGALYRVDPETGNASRINLGGGSRSQR